MLGERNFLKMTNTLIEIYSGSPWQVGMVRSLLEDAGINTYMQDVIMGTMNTWWTAPGGAGAIKLMISENDFEQARRIVEKYEENQKADNKD